MLCVSVCVCVCVCVHVCVSARVRVRVCVCAQVVGDTPGVLNQCYQTKMSGQNLSQSTKPDTTHQLERACNKCVINV